MAAADSGHCRCKSRHGSQQWRMSSSLLVASGHQQRWLQQQVATAVARCSVAATPSVSGHQRRWPQQRVATTAARRGVAANDSSHLRQRHRQVAVADNISGGQPLPRSLAGISGGRGHCQGRRCEDDNQRGGEGEWVQKWGKNNNNKCNVIIASM